MSVLRIDGGDFTVKASTGISKLGGEDFDDRLVDYFIEVFHRQHNKSISGCKAAVWRLRLACEDAKRTLSSKTKTEIFLKNFYYGIDFNAPIARGKFEEICGDLFQTTIASVLKVLTMAKMGKHEIQEVVLVGGSTRIPKIQSTLREFFNNKELCKSLHPIEAVAYGAAIQAAILKGDTSSALEGIRVHDVIPVTLGIETPGGVMTQIILANSQIPVESKQIISAQTDDRNSVSVRIYEGERALVRDNNTLGDFTLTELQPITRQLPQREVSFLVDADGILSAKTPNWVTGKADVIEINKYRLNNQDVQQSATATFYSDDEEQMRIIALRQDIEKYIYSVKAVMVKDIVKNSLTFCQHFEVTTSCNALLHWLGENALATREQLEQEWRDVRVACAPALQPSSSLID